MKTPNGENPLVHGAEPILGCDVWEHSYYIDYRNRRPDYIKAFLDHLVNWEHMRRDVQSRDHAQSGLKFHASRTNTGAAVSRAFLLPRPLARTFCFGVLEKDVMLSSKQLKKAGGSA